MGLGMTQIWRAPDLRGSLGSYSPHAAGRAPSNQPLVLDDEPRVASVPAVRSTGVIGRNDEAMSQLSTCHGVGLYRRARQTQSARTYGLLTGMTSTWPSELPYTEDSLTLHYSARTQRMIVQTWDVERSDVDVVCILGRCSTAKRG